MRRIDLGVFESAGNEIGDLVSLAVFLGPELQRPGGAECAAAVMKQWADGDPALLALAETIAHREHHEHAADILHRAHDIATVWRSTAPGRACSRPIRRGHSASEPPSQDAGAAPRPPGRAARDAVSVYQST
jgi:hypothetical protein